jgi:hypothetical protein
MGGITVRPDRGTYHAITADSGGYAIPVLEPGDLYGDLQRIRDRRRNPPGGGRWTSRSFLLDLVRDCRRSGSSLKPSPGRRPPFHRTRCSSAASSTPTGRMWTTISNTAPSTQYGDISDGFSTTANENVAITVSRLSAGTLYHFRLVVVGATATVYGNDRSFVTAPADGTDAPKHLRRRWGLLYRHNVPQMTQNNAQ